MLRKIQNARRFATTCHFATLEDQDVAFFRQNCTQVLDNPEDVALHNVDWTKKYIGNSKLVLKPKSSEEVSKVLAYCNDRKLAVVP